MSPSKGKHKAIFELPLLMVFVGSKHLKFLGGIPPPKVDLTLDLISRGFTAGFVHIKKLKLIHMGQILPSDLFGCFIRDHFRG